MDSEQRLLFEHVNMVGGLSSTNNNKPFILYKRINVVRIYPIEFMFVLQSSSSEMGSIECLFQDTGTQHIARGE